MTRTPAASAANSYGARIVADERDAAKIAARGVSRLFVGQPAGRTLFRFFR
jgi:hypothetical protein